MSAEGQPAERDLVAALTELGITADATIASVQRRLHVGAGDAMRLLALREIAAALASRAAAPPEKGMWIAAWREGWDARDAKADTRLIPHIAEAVESYDRIASPQERPTPAAPPECAWTLMDDDSTDYETSCGHAWQFMDGGPTENGMRFCPYCGAHLVTRDEPASAASSGAAPQGMESPRGCLCGFIRNCPNHGEAFANIDTPQE